MGGLSDTTRRLIAETALLCWLSPAPAAAGVVPRIDPGAYGAKCDGAADDTAALREAAGAIPSAGGTLVLPRGVCLIHATVYLTSHTSVLGTNSTIRAALPWRFDHQDEYALMENAHHDAKAIEDEDIDVTNVVFDYGNVAALPTPRGGKHALRFVYTRDANVENNMFLLRGAEDAVAGLGVEHMRIAHNSAYGFRNCAFDFWSGPRDVEVIDNYAQTETSAQMVNFNPERTAGDSDGLVARGFRMSGNTLVATGPKAVPLQIEPLGPGTAVRDVTIDHNKLYNAFLALRGNVIDATVEKNVITNVAGGPSAFETYPHWGAVADRISFTDNRIVAPRTHSPEVGVIRMEATGSTVARNVVEGGDASTPPIYAGQYSVTIDGNLVRKGRQLRPPMLK